MGNGFPFAKGDQVEWLSGGLSWVRGIIKSATTPENNSQKISIVYGSPGKEVIITGTFTDKDEWVRPVGQDRPATGFPFQEGDEITVPLLSGGSVQGIVMDAKGPGEDGNQVLEVISNDLAKRVIVVLNRHQDCTLVCRSERRFPHLCPQCNARALILFNTLECIGKGCRNVIKAKPHKFR